MLFSFLQGNGDVPIGEVLGTDICIHWSSSEKDNLPLPELADKLKRVGFKKLISLFTADYTPENTMFIHQADMATARLYRIEKDMEELLGHSPLTTLGNNYLLITADKQVAISQLEEVVFRLQLKGYTPVLIHAEHYTCLQGDYRNIQRLTERGCLLQMEMLSLTGHRGSAAKRLAYKMMQSGQAAFVGSGVATIEEHKKFDALAHTRWLTKLLKTVTVKNSELV